MLNKHVNVCLLNDACGSKGKKCVKMHDLVRDMALKITSGSPRYLVKAGVGLRSVPGQENWDDDLEKVSLMRNSLISISEVEPTKCSRLSTLLLQRNYLWTISNSFFLHMRVLNVLDLSHTFIECLPESVSDLTNLTALFLRNCLHLRSVPSLAKLVNLRLLDMSNSSRVEEIPNGLNMLTKLRYLNLSHSGIRKIPEGILCNLIDLQYLAFGCSIPHMVEEIKNLTMLENFFGVIHEFECFNALVRSFESRELTAYGLLLRNSIFYFISYSPDEENKAVFWYQLTIRERSAATKLPLSLPKDVEIFCVEKCILNVESLCEIASFKNVTKLRRCTVVDCQKIKHAFSYSSDIFLLLQSLEELNLLVLPGFRGLIFSDRGTSSPFPHGAFSSLKLLTVTSCKILKKLIITSLLPNLEELSVGYCNDLIEISVGGGTCSDNDKGEEGSSSTVMITLLNSRS